MCTHESSKEAGWKLPTMSPAGNVCFDLELASISMDHSTHKQSSFWLPQLRHPC